MADLQGKAGDMLKEIMSDPEMASKLKDVMGMLGGPQVKESKKEESSPLGMDSIASVARIKKLYDKVMSQDDPRLNLLTALRPYLSNKRLSRLDNAMKIVQMTRLTSIMGEFDKM